MPEAEAEFKRAIAMAPKDELANRTLSSFYLATGRTSEAEPYFKAVVEATRDVAPRLALADFYVQQQRTDEAVRLLEPLTGDRQYGGAASARLALIEYAAGKKTEAHQRLDAVLGRDARNPHANVAKGRFLLGEQKPADALARMKTAVEADPVLVEGHYWLGIALTANGQDVEALKAFNEALRVNPRLAAAQIQAARLELAAGNAASAVSLADSAIAVEPGSREARLILARALVATREFGRADEQVKALMQGVPPSADLFAMQGMVLSGLGNRPAARAAFERAAALAPGAAEPLTGLVALDLADKKPEEARARVDRQLKAAPDDPALLLLGARLNLQLKDFAAAEPMLRKVITLQPSQLPAYDLLGNLYFTQQRHEEALREFDALSQRQPDNVGAATMSGIILEAMGKGEEARARYEAVVQRNPRAAVASNNLAWMYAAKGGNLDVALQLAQAAKREMPQAGEVNDTLGYVYLRKNLPGLALPLLRDAVAKLPDEPLARYHLALALQQQGDGPGARRELEQALKLNPAFEGADEARRVLSTLN
jgi:tetratricopeptide (TPR) repeat protein